MQEKKNDIHYGTFEYKRKQDAKKDRSKQVD